MKILIKLMACFLIAWLPIVGYPARASFRSENSTEVSLRHEHLSTAASSDSRIDDIKAPCAEAQTACQTGMGKQHANGKN